MGNGVSKVPFPPYLAEAGDEMRRKWGVKGNLGIEKLGEEKILLDFEVKEQALRF